MSTKSTIRHQPRDADRPGWHLYREGWETDAVYLGLRGILADLTLIDDNEGPWPGTVRLRLPVATARQLGRVPETFSAQPAPHALEDAHSLVTDAINHCGGKRPPSTGEA
ncbi:hypothetical protein [Paraburkholderia adhaesiva]|uniref:hypothetical protein n=1 Tax=Paraburkholderia adhaesiva TaxID=2883244 RepID=UPI001F451800|nr:hypothetical protein [Paraburkholderia adhaesiva]